MARFLPDSRPARILTLATLVNTLGNGLYLSVAVLFFIRVVRLSANQVGVGLSIAGLVALVAGVPVGHLADRRGPRGTYATTLALASLIMVSFCFLHGFWAFLVMVTLAAALQNASSAARGPLIRRYGGERPQEFRAYLRSVTNIGISVGTALAAVAVQVDTRTAYLLLVLGNALTFVVAAGILMLLPGVPPEPVNEGPRWIALRDRPYVLLTVMDGVMNVQFRILTVAFPLWLVTRTAAPRWLAAGAFLINTVLVVFLQVRASRNVDTPRAGGLAMRRAGVAFLVSCAVMGMAAGLPGWAAALLLMGGVAIHTVGELWHAAGGFEISFALAPVHATGQYQGLFGMGLGMGDAFGPALVTALCISWGRPGWLVMGALLAAMGAVFPAAVRLAERTPPRVGSAVQEEALA